MEYVFSDKIKNLKPSAIREILKYASDPGMIAFAAGNPSPETFPVKEMREISDEIYSSMATAALQYGITEGYAPLREKVRRRLKEKFDIGTENDEVIIVSGGQQGLDLSCKVMCNEGDTVLCEEISFIGALNAFRACNVNLVGVGMDSDGIIPEELEKKLRTEKNVKLLYIIPTFQNPTGRTLPTERRKAVYELCRKYGVTILEDNPYGELRFMGEEAPTVKSMDTDGIVIYCGSFSKIMSAGIRVGFVSAPKEIASKITVAKQVNDVQTNGFFQILIDKFIEKYGLDDHIRGIRSIYRKKFSLMEEGLRNGLGSLYGDSAVFSSPEGGLFMWGELPEGTDIMALSKSLIARLVAIVPGSAFMADTDKPSYAFRLNYSTPSEEQIVAGTAILTEEIKKILVK